ncbi:MAG TPA: hypothetical protein VMV40_01020 [Acidiferrobacter sp.]|nr:hypothetical protein [Acidiferrobacter sp.]
MPIRLSRFNLSDAETRCPLETCIYNVHKTCPGPRHTRRNSDAKCHALPVLYLLMRFRLEDNGVRVFRPDTAERVAMDRKQDSIHGAGWYWKKGKVCDGPYRSETAACDGARVYLDRTKRTKASS